MSVLTAADLAEALNFGYLWRGAYGSKPNIRAALQAIEDAVQSASNVGPRSLKAYLALAIENAAPGAFTNQQKDDLFTIWTRYNARRGGLI